MIIDFDGRELTVPPEVEKELTDQLFSLMVDKVYPSIPQPVRLGMMVYSRNKLRDIELANIQAGYDAAHIRSIVRPPAGGDPNLHYLRIMLADTLKDMGNAILAISTQEGTDTVSSFSLPINDTSEGGRPLSIRGNERERENVGNASGRPAVS